MSMVCPKCQGSFEGLAECPKCRVRLLYQREERPRGKVAVGTPEEKWHQTPLGRTFAGLLLASGLGYGLLHLIASSLYLMDKESGAGELTARAGLFLFIGVQAFGVLVGATLAGVGRGNGVWYGMVVGLLSCAAVLAGIRTGVLTNLSRGFVGDLLTVGGADGREVFNGVPLRLAVVYGMPLTFLLCGLVGGFIGSRIWKPPASLAMPTFVPVESKPVQELTSSGLYRPPPKAEPSVWSGPIAWLRIICGVAIAFAGAVLSKRIIELIQALSEGMMKIQSNYQETIAMREIFAVSLFLGACVAGATRPNGLKQGLIVGLAGGLMQGALLFNNPRAADSLVYVVPTAFFLAPVGGWFGSSLLPPAPGRK